MQDDPMTQEEINAAREWIGVGDEFSDADIVEVAKGSLWLAFRRIAAARQNLGSALADCMKDAIGLLKRRQLLQRPLPPLRKNKKRRYK
jgi:hypothetical protein